MSEPVRVFVSYASPDRAFAEKLVADLQAAGAEVWWDVSGIDEGDFLGKINQALQQCQWLVLVLTPNAVASKWVSIEVNAGINRREKGLMRGVLPVLASPMAYDAIPPVWDNLHRYDGVGNYPGEVARLIRTLGISEAQVEPPRAQLATPAAPPHVAPPDRFPPRLASLGYRVAFLNGAEVILPPLCDVPAGPFLMGSDPTKDEDAQEDEQPQHWVTLGAYQIAKYPVTVAEYACFMRATGYVEPKSPYNEMMWEHQQVGRLDHPAVNVSWHDALAYVHWLNNRTNQAWRLSSETQWEKAARWDARTGTAHIYPWGDAFDEKRCNTSESKRSGTTAVGSYPIGASPCGALDMAGNVWEWTSTPYLPYPYTISDETEQVEGRGTRVLRGGSWSSGAKSARSSRRGVGLPDYTGFEVGFRLILAVSISNLTRLLVDSAAF